LPSVVHGNVEPNAVSQVERQEIEPSAVPRVPRQEMCFESATADKTQVLGCPDGQTIAEITRASFGLPIGTCFDKKGWTMNPSCHEDVISAFELTCKDKQSCTVSADSASFGAPCVSPNGHYRLVISYFCKAFPIAIVSEQDQLQAKHDALMTEWLPQNDILSLGSYNDSLGNPVYEKESLSVGSPYTHESSPSPKPIKKCFSTRGNGTLMCPVGRVITSINKGSFGSPSGSCSSDYTIGDCHVDPVPSLLDHCLHRQRCDINATTAVFGEPTCKSAASTYAVAKSDSSSRLIVQYECGYATDNSTTEPASYNSTFDRSLLKAKNSAAVASHQSIIAVLFAMITAVIAIA